MVSAFSLKFNTKLCMLHSSGEGVECILFGKG